MQVVVAANELVGPRPWVFLAGSIEQGRAAFWQDQVIAGLGALGGTMLNPRRPDWDASWRQSIDEPRFREQVEWELSGLEQADIIAVYFDPATRAPITLMELGLFARSGKAIVACPEGYWRKGNVDITCARYGVESVGTLDALIAALGRRIEAFQ